MREIMWRTANIDGRREHESLVYGVFLVFTVCSQCVYTVCTCVLVVCAGVCSCIGSVFLFY